jgi:hypothetical protein
VAVDDVLSIAEGGGAHLGTARRWKVDIELFPDLEVEDDLGGSGRVLAGPCWCWVATWWAAARQAFLSFFSVMIYFLFTVFFVLI